MAFLFLRSDLLTKIFAINIMATIATIPDMDIEIIQFSSKAICVQCPESLITIDNIIVYLRQCFATGVIFLPVLKWKFGEQDLFYETYRRIANYMRIVILQQERPASITFSGSYLNHVQPY